MITYWPATAGAQLDAATMRSCTLLLALAAADATRWLGGAARGGSTLTSRKLFATEELEHPFSALAAFLCEAPELGEKGPKRVRRALLALSTSTKTVKFVDGATHHAIKMGASAASGATVAERVAAARDVAGRGPRALKKRASAACRARMALEALEACELCRRAPEGDIVETSRGACEVCVVEEDARCIISIHWRSGATKLVTALDADACDVVTPDFQRARASAALLELAEDVVDSLRETLASLKNGTEVVLVGHGGGGAVAALAASLLSGVVRRPPTPPKKPQQQLGDLNLAQKREPPRPPPFPSQKIRCVSVGCAPCLSAKAARSWDPRRARCTTVLLGDDCIGRCSPSALRRLRKRLRRFLPASAGGALGAVRLGAALAGSAFEQGMGAAGRAVTDEQRTKLTDDDELRLPGDVFFLKPRADGAVGVYRGGAGRAREELLWQLNDVLLSKSMLAHATLDAYISALDRI